MDSSTCHVFSIGFAGGICHTFHFPKPPSSCAKGFGHLRSGPEFPRCCAPGRPQKKISAVFLGDYPRIYYNLILNPLNKGVSEFDLDCSQKSSISGLAGVSGSSQNAVTFSKSRALLGTISNVERARVSELQNPDPDKGLAPHWRVLRLKID